MKSEAHVRLQQRVRRAALAAACFVVALLAWPLEASAHRVGISSGKYVSDGANVEAIIAFRRDDLARAVPSLDADANGLLSDAELTPSAQGTADLLATVGAERGGTACPGKLAKLVADGGDGVSFTVRFEGCTGDASVQIGRAHV